MLGAPSGPDCDRRPSLTQRRRRQLRLRRHHGRRGAADRGGATTADLERWAADTWRSFEAMVDDETGLPADNIDGDLDPATRSRLHLADQHRRLPVEHGRRSRPRHHQQSARPHADEADADTLAPLERNEPSGMFYNWYDEHTGDVLTTWPDDGHTVIPFLSSVDNGWFAAACASSPAPSRGCGAGRRSCYKSMNFGCFYNPDARPDADVGLLRGGFCEVEPDPTREPCTSVRATTAAWARRLLHLQPLRHSITEPRIATYLGIANGQIPPQGTTSARTARSRSAPATVVFEQQPQGRYAHVPRRQGLRGRLRYRGMQIVPSWGGDMFEALMLRCSCRRSSGASSSWGVNHPLTSRARSSTAWTRRATATGASRPSHQPVRRLPRVRRRRDRHEPGRLRL